MTKQRFSDIEDAILVGLLEAPSHNETPFIIDVDIFTTPFKKRVAAYINKHIDAGTPEMALFNIENMVDDTPSIQHEWIDINGDASKLGFGLPVSALNRYYDSLIIEYKTKIVKEY